MLFLFVVSWYLYFVRQAGYVFNGVDLQDTSYTNRHTGNVFKGVEDVACQQSEVFCVAIGEVYMLRISSGWHRFYILDFEMYRGIVS
jgi:hypothetical protein